jgi:hypothetical protein
MVANFTPDRVAIDYDHLAVTPSRPGDGIAAGWLKAVELRANGDELWGRVEWTSAAATRIKAKEYKFISPCFSSDYTTNTGAKVGATLLGAALTNAPFLNDMQAVVLAADARMFGALGLPTERAAAAVALATGTDPDRTGTRVTFNPADDGAAPELTEAERRAVYRVVATSQGVFAQLVRADDGTAYGWYPEGALVPAPASAPDTTITEGPRGETLTDDDATVVRVPEPDDADDDEDEPLAATQARAAAYETAVSALIKGGTSAKAAMHLALTADPRGARAWQRVGGVVPEAPAVPAAAVRALRSDPEPAFDRQVEALVKATGTSWRSAARTIALAHPDLYRDRDAE